MMLNFHWFFIKLVVHVVIITTVQSGYWCSTQYFTSCWCFVANDDVPHLT